VGLLHLLLLALKLDELLLAATLIFGD